MIPSTSLIESDITTPESLSRTGVAQSTILAGQPFRTRGEGTTVSPAGVGTGDSDRQTPSCAFVALRESAPDCVDGNSRRCSARIRGQFMKNAARNLQLMAELVRLLDLFAKNGITIAPFKGVVLASSVYGDLALRDAGDIDLLVHRNDIVRAADLLVAMGHRPFYPTASTEESAFLSSLQGSRRAAYLQYHGEHHLVREDGMLNIDLHWQVSHRAISRGLDAKTLCSGLSPVEIGGRTVLTFMPKHLLLVLCDNGAKDGWADLTVSVTLPNCFVEIPNSSGHKF